ncbi:MAG: hypothetical protein HY259_01670 [Chloroflexi bacterium]|nr:hypothetical protein [Chloroflexota bacterium]MBI3732151.1 hypothetical protein [Chloroflexota bacterium]
MDLIYLDYNCFQRGFDDPRQIRIQMEALACQQVFISAENESVNLVWSFMHQDETLLCPFPDRKDEVFRLAALCKVRAGPQVEIYRLAQSFYQVGLSPKDAIHFACAVHTGSDFFLTCDDRLIKQAKQVAVAIKVMNPVDYVRQESA